MKSLVIYHANCADGFGAAFAAWLKFGDEAEYLPMKYLKDKDKTDDELCAEFNKAAGGWGGRELYILDFSLPRPVMNLIFELSDKVIWLDHHKSAFEMWCPWQELHMRYTETVYDVIILDNNKSGAMLAWEYFHPDKKVPMLIKHIDDYDLWRFKIKGTKEFNKALWSYAPWSFEQWHAAFFHQTGFSVVNSFENYNELYLKYYTEGAAILRAHDANVQAVVEGAAIDCEIQFYESSIGVMKQKVWRAGISANCPPHLASDVGHKLANKSGTYGLLWYINKEGKCICSLRSNGSYDVSAIAKAFGGGGHKNAAGFEVDIQTLLGWIK